MEVNERLGEFFTLSRLLVDEVDSADSTDLQIRKDLSHF
jgi:hypothetical protein